MIQLARIHAYRAGVFHLVDVPQAEVQARRLIMSRLGWIVTHVEYV